GWEEVGLRPTGGGVVPLLAASVSQHCEGCVVSAGGTRVLSRETTCQRLWRSAVGWVRVPAAPHCTMCAGVGASVAGHMLGARACPSSVDALDGTMCASRSPRCPLPQAACSLLHRCGAYAERFRPTGAHTRGHVALIRRWLKPHVHASKLCILYQPPIAVAR